MFLELLHTSSETLVKLPELYKCLFLQYKSTPCHLKSNIMTQTHYTECLQ